MKNNDIQLFTAYLESDLSKAEVENFENRLKDDPAFTKDFEEFKEIYQVLENRFSPERAAFIKNIQKTDSHLDLKNKPQEKPRKLISFKPWQIGVAASILLVIGFFIFKDFAKPSYSDYAQHADIVLTVRSATDSLSKKAEFTFNSGNYEEAISHFDALLEKTPDNTEIQLYKAIAQVETDKYSEAELILKSLSEGNSVYAYKAVYWQALSMIKQKKYKEAKAILQTIPAEVAEYQKAKKLLSKL